MTEPRSKESESAQKFTIAVIGIAAGPFGAFVFGRRLIECISSEVYQGFSRGGKPFYYPRSVEPFNYYLGVGLNSSIFILSIAFFFFGIKSLIESIDQ